MATSSLTVSSAPHSRCSSRNRVISPAASRPANRLSNDRGAEGDIIGKLDINISLYVFGRFCKSVTEKGSAKKRVNLCCDTSATEALGVDLARAYAGPAALVSNLREAL